MQIHKIFKILEGGGELPSFWEKPLWLIAPLPCTLSPNGNNHFLNINDIIKCDFPLACCVSRSMAKIWCYDVHLKIWKRSTFKCHEEMQPCISYNVLILCNKYFPKIALLFDSENKIYLIKLYPFLPIRKNDYKKSNSHLTPFS